MGAELSMVATAVAAGDTLQVAAIWLILNKYLHINYMHNYTTRRGELSCLGVFCN